ncbi:MAG: YdcF family protein [Acidobacteria bacterium]|nr:YdcF family protein [Acidobacteriota bacterium]
MSSSTHPPARARRLAKPLLTGLLLLLLAYIAAISVLVVRQRQRDEARPADAIVVFGAAEYAGRPSPVFRARLDHAYDLYERGLAPFVIATGGGGNDPRFTEGGVGVGYLERRGIPGNRLLAETGARNTDASAERVAVIMRAHGMGSCIAVSDGYHLFRIKRMMASQGVEAFGSPRAEARSLGRWRAAQLVAREVLSFTLWRLHIR